MIDAILSFYDREAKEQWNKKVVIFQPHINEIIRDNGLIFNVRQIIHDVNQSPPITVELHYQTIRGNTHWELGHERGWELQQ